MPTIHASVERRIAKHATGDVTWAPSHPDRRAPEPKPLFFYHVPKTGGLSFYLAMMHAFSHGWEGRPKRSLGRFDAPVETYASDNGLPKDAIFAASHHAFGFHERFGTDFALATIVRDPVKRVASAYTYDCMRANRAPSATEFEAFIARPENIDVIPLQLTGSVEKVDADEAIARAITHLETRFDAYVASEQVGELLSAYLSAFGLPNVLMENLNRTLPRFRIDVAPWAEEIHARNAVGSAIYRYVSANPRLPKTPFGETLHPKAVVIRAVEKRKRAMEESIAFRTEDLMHRLEAKSDFWILPEEAA